MHPLNDVKEIIFYHVIASSSSQVLTNRPIGSLENSKLDHVFTLLLLFLGLMVLGVGVTWVRVGSVIKTFLIQ